MVKVDSKTCHLVALLQLILGKVQIQNSNMKTRHLRVNYGHHLSFVAVSNSSLIIFRYILIVCVAIRVVLPFQLSESQIVVLLHSSQKEKKTALRRALGECVPKIPLLQSSFSTLTVITAALFLSTPIPLLLSIFSWLSRALLR